jgi:hypothetical protein
MKVLASDFATEVMTAGPFWFSALKFRRLYLELRRSCPSSGLTGVSQLQPGSETCAPSGRDIQRINGSPLYE